MLFSDTPISSGSNTSDILVTGVPYNQLLHKIKENGFLAQTNNLKDVSKTGRFASSNNLSFFLKPTNFSLPFELQLSSLYNLLNLSSVDLNLSSNTDIRHLIDANTITTINKTVDLLEDGGILASVGFTYIHPLSTIFDYKSPSFFFNKKTDTHKLPVVSPSFLVTSGLNNFNFSAESLKYNSNSIQNKSAAYLSSNRLLLFSKEFSNSTGAFKHSLNSSFNFNSNTRSLNLNNSNLQSSNTLLPFLLKSEINYINLDNVRTNSWLFFFNINRAHQSSLLNNFKNELTIFLSNFNYEEKLYLQYNFFKLSNFYAQATSYMYNLYPISVISNGSNFLNRNFLSQLLIYTSGDNSYLNFFSSILTQDDSFFNFTPSVKEFNF